MPQKISVHFMPGDGHGWALDEDRRQMCEALQEIVCETSLTRAQVIHTPFWQGLRSVAPKILRQAFVIAHADNPPFFYLKQPEFFLGQQQVDLWVARSQEALEQFRALRLPVKYIPYTIDPELFFPIVDKKSLRERFGIPRDRYVIANFHRDTEGADLAVPKLQKAPELMLEILKKLQDRGANIHVLLAGPRRHWLRKELMCEQIPFTFIGKSEVEEDDFGINILDRATLNELTNAADLYLIPSRWEGGPQSVMEAAACQCKIMSTPLGVALDILEPSSLFHSAAEASEKIFQDITNGTLQSTIQPQWERWKKSHTTKTMLHGLRELYAELPINTLFQKKSVAKKTASFKALWQQVTHAFKTRLGYQSLPKEIGWNHSPGKNRDFDEVMLAVGQALKALGIGIRKTSGHGIEFIGCSKNLSSYSTEDCEQQRCVSSRSFTDDLSTQLLCADTPCCSSAPANMKIGSKELPAATRGCVRVQWIMPNMPIESCLQADLLVAPSVQDIINLRREGVTQPAVVIPFPVTKEKKEELSREPLVVDWEDYYASMKIWRAMFAARPIVYPEHSAYYEQVFHAGLPYKNESDLPEVIASAREAALELSTLARVPTMSSAKNALEKLLFDVA